MNTPITMPEDKWADIIHDVAEFYEIFSNEEQDEIERQLWKERHAHDTDGGREAYTRNG